MHLVQALGPDFARSAIGNRDQHVSRRVLDAIAAPIPSASQLDAYMQDIAQRHGVMWTPDPPRQSMSVCSNLVLPCTKSIILASVNVLSEVLDPEAGLDVDLPRLRKLCQHGMHNHCLLCGDLFCLRNT
jgi:hypothetical protein